MAMGRRMLLAATAAAALTPMVVLGATAMRIHRTARRAIGAPAAVGGTIVVLGAWARADGPGRILRCRLDHALALAAQGGHRLAMAGGVPPHVDEVSGGHDEVEAMVSYALAHGVPAAGILELRPGQNTREQVTATRRLVWDAGLGPITVVSSSYHLARVQDEARRQGFAVAVSAPFRSPDQDGLRMYRSHLAADTLALLWYALPPKIAARVNTSAGTFRHLGVMALTGDVDWPTALRSVVQPRQSAYP